MYTTLDIIAEIYHFGSKDFCKFASENAEKYHLDIKDSSTLQGMSVSTWFANKLVDDYRATCQEFRFEYSSDKTVSAFFSVYGKTFDEAKAVAEEILKSFEKYGVQNRKLV